MARAIRLLLLAVILTDWGTFTCSVIRCERTPERRLEGYWSSPTFFVTRHHVPLATRTCDPVAGLVNTWDCRSGGRAAPVGAAERNDDWEWATVSVSADDE